MGADLGGMEKGDQWEHIFKAITRTFPTLFNVKSVFVVKNIISISLGNYLLRLLRTYMKPLSFAIFLQYSQINH